MIFWKLWGTETNSSKLSENVEEDDQNLQAMKVLNKVRTKKYRIVLRRLE